MVAGTSHFEAAKKVYGDYFTSMEEVVTDIVPLQKRWENLTANNLSNPDLAKEVEIYRGLLVTQKLAETIIKTLAKHTSNQAPERFQLRKFKRDFSDLQETLKTGIPLAAIKLDALIKTSRKPEFCNIYNWGLSWVYNTPYLDAALKAYVAPIIIHDDLISHTRTIHYSNNTHETEEHKFEAPPVNDANPVCAVITDLREMVQVQIHKNHREKHFLMKPGAAT